MQKINFNMIFYFSTGPMQKNFLDGPGRCDISQNANNCKMKRKLWENKMKALEN